MDLSPLLLSLKIATVATALVSVVGLGLAVLLAKVRFPGKSVVETLINLPLVLPPSVVGYYLLLFLGRRGPLGGLRLVFTWKAAVVASAVVALPLMVRTSRAAIESVDPSLELAARTLGSPPIKALWDITIPLARQGILAGMVMSFARALGEFGATLMVAGNIPGSTRTVPLAIYTAVQANRMHEANLWVLLMTAIAFAIVFAVDNIQKRWCFPQDTRPWVP